MTSTISAPIAAMLTDEQRSRFTGYPVALPVFEGPLDLLLYLIKRQEIDIYDIPVARITAQFLDYMTLMEALDVELASEFIVMAATLLEIKSRMLLPRPPVLEEEHEVEEDEDPRAELVRRLLEYQQYKSAAQSLYQRADEQTRIFPRPSIVEGMPPLHGGPELDGSVDAFALWTALQEVLTRIEAVEPAVREVARPKVTIRKQMLHILHLLTGRPEGIIFADIFFYPERDHPLTRTEVIVTFLAILELIRLKRIRVQQRALFGEIRVVGTGMPSTN